MKTAKELFEELGFSYCDKLHHHIQISDTKGQVYIWFLFDTKSCNILDYEEEAIKIGIKLHLAIHQQMKELGWIE